MEITIFKSLLICILIISLRCDTTNHKIEETNSKISISKTENWNNNLITYAKVHTKVGEVPILFYIPENPNSKSLIVALHYQNSNKEVWLNSLNGILNFAIETKTAFFACDLYGHGEWSISNYNTNLINENNLDTFMIPTTIGVSDALRTFCINKNLSIDSLQYVAISLGCFTAMDLSINDLKPKTMILSAPVPLKNYNGNYSFHNNLDAFNQTNILAITGTKDQYNEPNEVQWWIDQVNSNNKKLISYEGGHVPPLNMIDSCIIFLNDQLN